VSAAPTKGRGALHLSSGAKVTLAIEILGEYLRIRLSLWRSDLPSTLRSIRAAPVSAGSHFPAGPAAQEFGRRLARAVNKTLGRLPFDSRCLLRSLVLLSLLAKRGLPASLVIGVTSKPQFGAHAWIESKDGALLSTNGEGHERLVRL
jgi:hypothetical protein